MTNSYSFPTDPEPVAYDSTGAPIYEWADGHQCPDCADHPHGLCATCRADMEDTARADEARARWEEEL